jgi:L,D-transpeptidase ErfK/SrfK
LKRRKNIAVCAPTIRDAAWRRLAGVAVLGCLAWSGPALAWDLPKEPSIVGNDSRVEVFPGESLYQVARRHGYAMEHLAEANRLPISMAALGASSVTIPGRRILPSEPPAQGLVVNLPERGFYVFGSGEPRFFPIAIGQPGRFETPTGSFRIVEKVENPDWVAPEWAGLGEDNVIQAGPDNPLGDRWIGLSWSGLGMHATNNPASIGSATSHGCMRMYPEVARTVFDMVRTGWPVRIEYETSRVALERSGISVAGFPDVYSRGRGVARLREQFGDQDLLGFYLEETCRPVLEAARGTPIRVVDLSPKAWFGSDWFPAARLGNTLYVEQGVLEAAGARAQYSLAERSVRLERGERSLTLPLYLPSELDRGPQDAFLSRGSGWYPARKALGALGLHLTWEGKENRLRVAR